MNPGDTPDYDPRDDLYRGTADEIIFGRDWWIEGEAVRIRAIVPAPPDVTGEYAAPRAECVNAEGMGYYVMLRALHTTREEST